MLKLNFPALLALATLSGCLWFLAVTPFDLSLLAWLAAVPGLAAIDRAPTWRQALFLGWWAGVVETAGGFYWLIDVMQRFAEFPWIGAALVFFLFCAARALIFLLFAAIARGVRGRRPVPMTVLAPLAMVVSELVVPQIFPCGQWISQAWQPAVIQIAELTGPFGVTALLMMINGALYDLITRAPHARRLGLGAAALLAAALVLGAVRMREIDAAVARAPKLRVGLVQPNFAYTIDGTFSSREALRQLAALQSQSRRLEQSGAELVVWSEGSYPIGLPRDFVADFSGESPAMIRRGLTVPTLIGAIMIGPHDDAYNSALLLDTAGRETARYDKVQLLAFGEYVPGVETFPWLRKFLPEGAGRFTAGAAPALMTLRDSAGQVWKLGPLICYEDILQDYVGHIGALRPNLLVNLTSDSWFGATAEPWEHLALSVFASVELRVSMVRAVNSGVSALIDPNGRVVRKTYADDPYRNPRAEDGMVVSVPRMAPSRTFYDAAGNLFAWLCAAATLALIVIAARTKPSR
ncbi:MAG TPA: apolipoprotein N-acyltransferase [Steroidobacteraceae bacterium]|jgi:apolipoprotein N-acyltransferase|nr:apolipoprotein N-acyltransferase [Steroidobacteraceae bacterium]